MAHDFRLEHINTLMNAAQWRIDDLVCAGMSYQDAKDEAVKGMMDSQRGLPKEEKAALYSALQSLAPDDLSGTATFVLKERFRLSIEKARGRKMGRIERALYAMTGMTF